MRPKRRVLYQELNLETCVPPPKGRLLLRLPRIPTFLCSLRVKGTANRVVDGTRSLFPKRNFSSIRRQLIDYHDTRWDKIPISQEELFVHEVTNYRLLRHSIFGWDKIPISQEEFLRTWDDKLSTTSGTRPSEGHVPHIPRGFSRP